MLDKMMVRYKDRNTPPSLLVHVRASDLTPSVDETLPSDLKWVLRRMSDMNIAICSNGSFISGHTNQLVRKNSLVCMLRRDYMTSGAGKLQGKALNRMLEAALMGSVVATRKAESALPDLGKLEEVQVDFTKYEI
jgi:hypothetical protein